MRKYFVIIIFTHAVFVPALSQNIDSLKKVLPSLHDSARVDCLNELCGLFGRGDSFLKSALPDSMKYYAAFAYEESKKINYIHGIAEALSYEGEIEDYSDNSLTEEKLLREAIDWYEKTSNKKRLAETYLYLGDALYGQSYFAEAIKNLDIAYEWYNKNGNARGMYWALGLSGAVYEESGNYEKAFELDKKSLDMAIGNNDDGFRRFELTKIGYLFTTIEDYKTALEYYRQAFVNLKPEEIINGHHLIHINQLLELAELFTCRHQYDSAKYYYGFVDTSDQRAHRFYLVSIGGYYFSQKQYDKALPNFLRGLDYHKQYNDRNQVMGALLSIANTYLALGNNDSAFKYANESLSMAKQTGAKQVISGASEILSSIYDRWHKSDSAYFYYKKYTITKDSILNDQVKGKLAAYSFEQKIELLDKEKQIQQVQLQKQSLLKNIFIGSIIILFVLAAIIFRIIMLKRRNEAHRRELAENELQIQKLESQKQLSELEMQALRAQMNPHFIFNCLSSINLFILKNETEAASDYLIKFSRLIRMILNNSQKPLITLEDELDMLGLYIDMEKLRFKNSFDYSISFTDSIDPDNVFIPPLLFQPFAENAIWHGLLHKQGLGHLEISLSAEEKILTCIITDDGIGRSKAAMIKSKSAGKQKSMGLQITKERLALLNHDIYKQAFFIEDIIDDEGNDAGTRVILKMHYQDMSEACT